MSVACSFVIHMGQIYMEGYSFKMWGRLGKFNVDKFAKLESFIRNSREIKAISIGFAAVRKKDFFFKFIKCKKVLSNLFY